MVKASLACVTLYVVSFSLLDPSIAVSNGETTESIA